VEKAKQLLTHSKLVLSDIALDCGFNSQSHFGKSFRELVGTTPGKYQRNSIGAVKRTK
ncbi:MAG: helix-turn-helix domain-containing protein, partial [Cyanobacteria bacterium J06649_4]